MTKRTQITGRAEYAQALREHTAAKREAAAALADFTAAKAQLAAAPAARTDLAAIGKRLAGAQRLLDEIAKRVGEAREKSLGGESGFDQLSNAHPLLLLPVRLETRFAWLDGAAIGFDAKPALEQVLLVRIYPDEIHEDSHEPELTQSEARWIAEFRRKLLAARDSKPIQDAWAELIARAGATRAAWLGQLAIDARNPGKRAGTFTRPSVARLLPDCWVAYATLPDGSTLTAMSGPVREPLETGPSPTGMDWMINFEVAMKAGMALMVRAIPAAVTGIRRLVVVGARSTLDPAQTQAELEHLLDAHRYTRGLGMLAPGTATNSSPGTRAGFSTRPALPEIIAIEERRFRVGGHADPLCQRGDRTDGTALASALGIEPSTFAFVARANATDQVDAHLLRSILSAATRRPLTHLLDGIVDANTVAEMLAFANESVSALGPLPTLRAGSQPYAVLPVMLSDGVRFQAGSSAARYLPVLDRLRALWQTAASGLDWVGKTAADPGQALIRILQRDGVAGRLAFRPLLGPQVGASVAAGLTGRAAKTLRAQRDAAADAIDALGATRSANAPLLQTMLSPIAPALTDPIVQPEDAPAGSAQRAAAYLETVASLRPDELLLHQYGSAERPRALFFAIARLAMLELADARAREVLLVAGSDPAQWDDEDVPNYSQSPLGSPLRRLQAPDPADPLAPIAFHLSEQGRDSGVLQGMRDTLRYFKTRAPELIELQLRASLGLFSNRLDAWYTALATEQLREMRDGVTASMGINAGAYGVLEDIARAPRQPVAGIPGLFSIPTNGGYVHAPSVNHGAAAAVLRSVHLAHSAAGRGAAFSVDLSSERVRRALPLLEGIRAGQPLAALLGYRLERELGAERLQRYIAPLRGIAPLLANTLTPSPFSAESVAATNVVDGLTLLEKAGYDGDQVASVDTLWQRHASLGTMPAAGEYQAMQRVLASAQDAVDAVSDLVLAESVYQAVLGNPARSGAAVDSSSGAPVPPAELNVVRTPRSGVAATHRLLTLLDAGAAPGTGWASTPRAVFEPRLEAWCASVLPTPPQIRVRARFRRADGVVAASLDDVTLRDLFEAAEDAAVGFLPFGALDIVALADPRDTPQRSSLEVRLGALLELKRPDAAGAAALELVYERHENWDATAFGIIETLEIAAQLRNHIGHARPLAPEDFAMPGQPPSLAVDAAEHASRAQNAGDELANVRSVLAPLVIGDDASALREALFAADALGVAGAAPTSLRDGVDAREQARLVAQLRAQAVAVVAELARRIRRLSDAAADDSFARLKAVFGEAFVSLPVITGAGGANVTIGAAAGGADGAAVRSWLSRAARVREGARLLDGVLGAAQAVAQTQNRGTPPRLSVGQLGAVAGEAWIALPLAAGASLPGGRVSLVAVTSGAPPTKAVAGLFIDEWLEVVPASEETTSVAFHFEAPSSAPPQLLLLGVPTPGLERWTPDAARRLVAEALDLGRIRLVDMDDIPSLGQLLPAFVTAENTAGDDVGLDVEALTRTGAK